MGGSAIWPDGSVCDDGCLSAIPSESHTLRALAPSMLDRSPRLLESHRRFHVISAGRSLLACHVVNFVAARARPHRARADLLTPEDMLVGCEGPSDWFSASANTIRGLSPSPVKKEVVLGLTPSAGRLEMLSPRRADMKPPRRNLPGPITVMKPGRST